MLSTSSAAGSVPSGPVACITPTVLPAMPTGMHTAEHGPVERSRRYGHTLIASLDGNCMV